MKSNIIAALVGVALSVGFLTLATKVVAPWVEETGIPAIKRAVNPMSTAVFVDVEKYPDRMDLGFHNPSTGYMSAASCDVAGKDPEFLMTVVTENGVMQTYNCNHLDLSDL